MNIWFAGTPHFAAEILKDLLGNDNYNITGVLSQPDRKSGRGKKLTASPVKQIALDHQIPIVQPENLRTETQLFDSQERPDLCIVVAYGILLPKWFLNYPKYGCINIHASLLPRWRGAAPIQRAIAAGDQQTGVGVMQMNEGLDTGDIWHEEIVMINNDETAVSLTEKLIIASKKALQTSLPMIQSGEGSPIAQNTEGVTYAHKLTKEEAKIDWQESAIEIERKIRAFNPVPVAHTILVNEAIRIYEASIINESTQQAAGTIIKQDKSGFYVACGMGVLCIKTLQLSGKKAVSASQLINSKNWVGEQFSC